MADGAEMDMPAHERSYGNFLAMARWGAIVCAIIAAIVVLIIAR
ncbi:aa3-type cytochrome c oxidase subunit IV [Sphingomonas bacterium]|nr:aa3-type cytochrome c oxidase subunit IV [Sphingomonas bacterium]